jgi:hypothetical protein
MTSFWRRLLAAVAIVLAFALQAQALTINDPGVVGTVDGIPGDNSGTEALGFAQYLLNLGANVVDHLGPDGHIYSTSSTDYNNTLVLVDKIDVKDGSPVPLVPAGYKYALAKYDGQNAGFVLFYLPRFGNALPEFSYSIWGKNDQQYRITNFTYFNSVPDGGSAAVLLGSALLGLGLLRRQFGKR